MDNQTLLSQLRDIRLPDPPPQAPVWDLWLAAICLAAALALLAVAMVHRRPAWHREALAALKRVSQLPPDDALPAVARVVRRLAIHLGPPDVRHQSGSTYLHTLDNIFDTRFFTEGPGNILGNALYQPLAPQQDLARPIAGIRRLIRQRARRRD